MPLASSTRYRFPARLLHWTMAVLVIGMVPLGIAVNYLPWDAFQTWLFNLHKSLGILLLALIAIRIAYRLTHRPPPLPSALPAYQRVLAEGVHMALYGIILAMPIIGWVGTNAYGEPMDVFWSVTLPKLVDKNEALSEALWTLHNGLGLALGGLVTIHAGAALAHRFVRQDQVLARMWPVFGEPRATSGAKPGA
ncbi:cytochrome b [Microvirga pudoricolor]|uniref:cytochrome b n=1 Tax=Microvirga pudoricolor TaxID=2778729 RepID=UPI001950B90A|nr:cytochrome b [Microvirga pudoricolor]MBM6595471.1 cytochrome b [Microvirga pudoricolor]